MATFASVDNVVTVAGTDLSDDVASVQWDLEYDELDDSAMGDTGRSRIAGLEDGSVQLTFNQDFAASQVDATLQPLLGTKVSVQVKATSASTSATNPLYRNTFLISKYSPFSSSVGELAQVSVQWPVGSGTSHSRDTS